MNKHFSYILTIRRSLKQCIQKSTVPTAVALLSFHPLLRAEQEGDFTYSIKDDGVIITKYTGAGDQVNIPDKIGGLPVRTIDKGIFSGANTLTSVRIPSTVISHELWGYQTYDRLASISVDPANPVYTSVNGVLFDKRGATLFKYPSKRTGEHYDIPDGVTRIGLAAFNGAAELTSVTIPPSVTNIEANNFGGYNNLTIVTFEGNAPELGGAIFYQTPGDLIVRYYKGAIGFPMNWKIKQVEIDPATELIEWNSKDSKIIKAYFLKLDGEAVVVRTEADKEHKIPFSRLSAASVAQAKIFGGAPAPGAPSPIELTKGYLIGTKWSFPYMEKQPQDRQYIEFTKDEKLVCGWDLDRATNWSINPDGTVQLRCFIDQSILVTLRIDPTGKTGTLVDQKGAELRTERRN